MERLSVRRWQFEAYMAEEDKDLHVLPGYYITVTSITNGVNSVGRGTIVRVATINGTRVRLIADNRLWDDPEQWKCNGIDFYGTEFSIDKHAVPVVGLEEEICSLKAERDNNIRKKNMAFVRIATCLTILLLAITFLSVMLDQSKAGGYYAVITMIGYLCAMCSALYLLRGAPRKQIDVLDKAYRDELNKLVMRYEAEFSVKDSE